MILEELQRFIETLYLEELPGIAQGREQLLKDYPERKDTATYSDACYAIADRIRRGYEALKAGTYYP